MTGSKCKSCGSSEIEVDSSRGDTVCTNCGTVLEDSVIVSEIQFEENAHGGSTALGQFVSSDSSGGCRGFGHSFHSGAVKESRDITLQNAKRGLSNLCQQLRLNQHCLDTAFNFYKMALTRHLTRGRKNTHVLAACLYITCRIEGTPHLLIDFSDVLQICAFELGRTYLKLSQALCINVPSMDPCLYVLRFASKLEFGQKTHEVTMTALRIVQRMKRDSMHSGRRPSGICGAALLMAARLHDFNRTVQDVIKVVQVHESTLKKRLIEFGETPTSSLTLEEFMKVDLEEEQDPPSYKAARARDRERLKAMDEGAETKLSQLQFEIEKELFRKKRKFQGIGPMDMEDEVADDSVEELREDEAEENETESFIAQSTLGLLKSYLNSGSSHSDEPGSSLDFQGETEGKTEKFTPPVDGDLDLDGIDDSEIDSYIMSEKESVNKNELWHTINASYLQEKKEKEEKLAKEREEGKPEKKKRKIATRKKPNTPANSAGEAIEKMLQERKISTKINYDVLKSLSIRLLSDSEEAEIKPKLEGRDEEKSERWVKGIGLNEDGNREEIPPKEDKMEGEERRGGRHRLEGESRIDKKDEEIEDNEGNVKPSSSRVNTSIVPDEYDDEEEEDDQDDDDGGEVGRRGRVGEDEAPVLSLAQMLSQHNNDMDSYYDEDYDDDY